MRHDLDRVTDALIRASKEVAAEYIQLPVADQEEPEYRERVYCYELYHRWRVHWPEDLRYSLCGEIDKQGHPIIRGNHKPDFLVHQPDGLANLLIVEVKPANAEHRRIVDDLKKLAEFVRGWGADGESRRGAYYGAYMWFYGQPPDSWRLSVLRETLRSEITVDLSRISCFLHAEAGMAARRMDWACHRSRTRL